MDFNLPVMAGTVSISIFAVSTLPMIIKAFRTKDLRSYSLSHILLTNIGNAIYSIYIFSLPAGPVWLLHIFYVVTWLLLLIGYLLYQEPGGGHSQNSDC